MPEPAFDPAENERINAVGDAIQKAIEDCAGTFTFSYNTVLSALIAVLVQNAMEALPDADTLKEKAGHAIDLYIEAYNAQGGLRKEQVKQ